MFATLVHRAYHNDDSSQPGGPGEALGVPVAGSSEQQQQREGALLPQQVEDNMSSTQLIEGFSLQSLLHDMPLIQQPQAGQQVGTTASSCCPTLV